LKGFLAVWLTGLLTSNNELALALSACAVMLGHCYPIFLGFRGGKAVACFVGAFLYLTPMALGLVILVFVAVLLLSKYVSLGSLAGAATFPFLVWLTGPVAPVILAAAIFAALLVIYRHKANISRLSHGKEHTFSLRGGRSAA
jgi:glycerol-3-phosphate acyltransferase PlsY